MPQQTQVADEGAYARAAKTLKDHAAKQRGAAPAPAPATPAPAPAPATQTYRPIPNTLAHINKWNDIYVQHLQQQGVPDAQIHALYGAEGAAAMKQDGIRPQQVTLKNIRGTVAEDTLRRWRSGGVPQGVPTDPESMAKLEAAGQQRAAEESFRIAKQAAELWKWQTQRDMPEEEPPETTQPKQPKAVEMPAEEVVASPAPAPAAGKPKRTELPAEARPGMGDMQRAESQRPLRMRSPAEEEAAIGEAYRNDSKDAILERLRNGVKAWNADKLSGAGADEESE